MNSITFDLDLSVDCVFIRQEYEKKKSEKEKLQLVGGDQHAQAVSQFMNAVRLLANGSVVTP